MKVHLVLSQADDCLASMAIDVAKAFAVAYANEPPLSKTPWEMHDRHDRVAYFEANWRKDKAVAVKAWWKP